MTTEFFPVDFLSLPDFFMALGRTGASVRGSTGGGSFGASAGGALMLFRSSEMPAGGGFISRFGGGGGADGMLTILARFGLGAGGGA